MDDGTVRHAVLAPVARTLDSTVADAFHLATQMGTGSAECPELTRLWLCDDGVLVGQDYAAADRNVTGPQYLPLRRRCGLIATGRFRLRRVVAACGDHGYSAHRARADEDAAAGGHAVSRFDICHVVLTLVGR